MARLGKIKQNLFVTDGNYGNYKQCDTGRAMEDAAKTNR
jgi:hypothetical protein